MWRRRASSSSHGLRMLRTLERSRCNAELCRGRDAYFFFLRGLPTQRTSKIKMSERIRHQPSSHLQFPYLPVEFSLCIGRCIQRRALAVHLRCASRQENRRAIPPRFAKACQGRRDRIIPMPAASLVPRLSGIRIDGWARVGLSTDHDRRST
jgi:hypothetical protein